MDWMGLALMKRVSKDLLTSQLVAAKTLQGLQSASRLCNFVNARALSICESGSAANFLHDLIVEVHHDVG